MRFTSTAKSVKPTRDRLSWAQISVLDDMDFETHFTLEQWYFNTFANANVLIASCLEAVFYLPLVYSQDNNHNIDGVLGLLLILDRPTRHGVYRRVGVAHMRPGDPWDRFRENKFEANTLSNQKDINPEHHLGMDGVGNCIITLI